MSQPTFKTERINTIGNVVTINVIAFTQITEVTRIIFNNNVTETASGNRVIINTKL